MHLHGFKDILLVEIVYFVGNVITFLMRFFFFHFVLFAERTPDAGDEVIEPDILVAGSHARRHGDTPTEPMALSSSAN
jgi:hypothetical protein